MMKGLSNLKEPIQALTAEIEAMKEELKKQTTILEEIRNGTKNRYDRT